LGSSSLKPREKSQNNHHNSLQLWAHRT
jgi:hypothetical protein